MADEKARRPPVEPIVLDLKRLTDEELRQASVAMMRLVTSARSTPLQRLYAAAASALASALSRRDDTWLEEFAPELTEIGQNLGAEDGM